MNRGAALALMALALAVAPGTLPASAQSPPGAVEGAAVEAACDRQVRDALAASAQRGVEGDLAIIRHPGQGIRNPDSILDFSCLTDLFNYRAFDVLFDPGGALEDVLDLARRRICQTARDAYRRYLGRALDTTIYTAPVPRLPGLDIDGRYGNVLDDIPGGGDAKRFRSVLEGGR